ncbi:protein lifeguard [Pelomyxa schiedti]|nr:protein lifeguard [Pelomyxa schiedti]
MQESSFDFRQDTPQPSAPPLVYPPPSPPPPPPHPQPPPPAEVPPPHQDYSRTYNYSGLQGVGGPVPNLLYCPYPQLYAVPLNWNGGGIGRGTGGTQGGIGDIETASLEQSAPPGASEYSFQSRVYSWLTLELAFSGLIVALFCLHNQARAWLLHMCANPLAMILLLVITFISLIALQLLRKKHLARGFAMIVFLASLSTAVSVPCAVYTYMGLGKIVTMGLCSTVAGFLALSAIVLLTKRDFGFLSKWAMMAMVVLLVWGIMSLVFHVRAMGLVYSLVGCVAFSFAVLADTSRVMKQATTANYEQIGGHNSNGSDALETSIALYVDFLGLFSFVLRLFSGAQART